MPRIPLRLTQSPPRPLLEPRPRGLSPPQTATPTWLAPRFRPSRPHPLPDRCTWGSRSYTPAPQRRLFCRRSAAAAPPGSSSIAPGGGRGLGRTPGDSGLSEARRAARLARRSPASPPRASARPRPRPKLQSSRLRAPSMGGSGSPGPAPRLSPSHSLPLSWLRARPTPPRAAAPAHSAPVCRVRPHPAPPRSPATPLSHSPAGFAGRLSGTPRAHQPRGYPRSPAPCGYVAPRCSPLGGLSTDPGPTHLPSHC